MVQKVVYKFAFVLSEKKGHSEKKHISGIWRQIMSYEAE